MEMLRWFRKAFRSAESSGDQGILFFSLGESKTPPYSLKEDFMRAKRLTTQQRQEIFQALVRTQDLGLMTVSESVQHIAKQFEITEAQLRQIEDEGIDKEWPPLNEAAQPTISE